MSKSVIARGSRAYRLLGTDAVLWFLYTLQAVLAGGSGEAQVPASPGSGRRRGAMGKRAVVVGSLAVALAGITLAGEAAAQVPRCRRCRSPGRRTSPTTSATRRPPGSSARRCSGTCRWAATACRRARPATSAPAPTPGRRTRSARACSGSIFRPDETSRRVPDADLNFDGQGPNDTLQRRGLSLPASSRIPRNRESAIARRHEQRRVLAGRAPRDLRPGRPARAPTPTASASGRANGAATCVASSRATRRR